MKLKTVCFNLPMQKINISCSEVIPEDKYYFINIINSPKPYMIFSYYDDNRNNKWIVNEKQKFDTCNDKIMYLYDFFLNFIITNSYNIYINKDAFDKLNNDEKVYLYIIHRFGSGCIQDNQIEYYRNDICKFLFEV